MKKPVVFACFAVLSAVGVLVIALPDSGPRLAFSSAHGPGLVDVLGIVLLLLGSSFLWGYLWRARPSLKSSPARLRAMWTFGAGLGVGLLLASVFSDFSAWWAVGAGLLTLVQFSLFAVARR